MNTASLELCKELYQLSGWDTERWHVQDATMAIGTSVHTEHRRVAPAYDLGYLLRKLPSYAEQGIFAGYLALDAGSRDWRCGYKDDTGVFVIGEAEWTDTPENALTMLAIELHKAGVLERES